MAMKILGYKELLKTLVEYHITFVERLAHEGYDKTFSILLFPWPGGDEEKLRELLLPLLRRSDRVFYIEENIVLLLPGTDWNGAMKVRETLEELFGPREEKECIVEYPSDGSDAFELISGLYAQCEGLKGE